MRISISMSSYLVISFESNLWCGGASVTWQQLHRGNACVLWCGCRCALPSSTYAPVMQKQCLCLMMRLPLYEGGRIIWWQRLTVLWCGCQTIVPLRVHCYKHTYVYTHTHAYTHTCIDTYRTLQSIVSICLHMQVVYSDCVPLRSGASYDAPPSQLIFLASAIFGCTFSWHMDARRTVVQAMRWHLQKINIRRINK